MERDLAKTTLADVLDAMKASGGWGVEKKSRLKVV